MSLNVSVASILNPTKSGYLTKQGGKWKTWKRRWFVLKGENLWYFKTQGDKEATGLIKLETTTQCQLENNKNNKSAKSFFTVTTPKRVFIVYGDSDKMAKEWVEAINSAVAELKGSGKSGGSSSSSGASSLATTTTPSQANMQPPTPASQPPPVQPAPSSTSAQTGSRPVGDDDSKSQAKDFLLKAKDAIPYLKPVPGAPGVENDEANKLSDFWQIWFESHPSVEEMMTAPEPTEYKVAMSLDMQKMTWRTAGAQSVYIQRMVDFFWNVGAPENEIDKLNDIGYALNPSKIGSWIDMSAKGGMDGGWYFPLVVQVQDALQTAVDDANGQTATAVLDWSKKHSVTTLTSVARDMGAAPPRQIEFKAILPGDSFDQQLEVAVSAFESFGFPPIPTATMEVVQSMKSNVGGDPLLLSIVTASSEHFVRIGLMIPHPNTASVVKMCKISGGSNDDLASFEGSIGSEGPEFLEVQYLKEGFGYGVYKEGFDVLLHYNVG